MEEVRRVLVEKAALLVPALVPRQSAGPTGEQLVEQPLAKQHYQMDHMSILLQWLAADVSIWHGLGTRPVHFNYDKNMILQYICTLGFGLSPGCQ